MKHLIPIALATVVVLMACGQRVEKTVPASLNVSEITMTSSRGNQITLRVSEVCYEGTLYLVNELGGMTAKLDSKVSNNPAIHCEK